MKSDTFLMTQGSIYGKITKFALPIFWGNLFQQLYNVVDSIVLGNFDGSNALAAISATGSLTFLLVGFFSGVFIGVGVVISRYFGAGDSENLQKAIHTAISTGIIFGIFLTIFGTIFTPLILRLMGTPYDVIAGAVTYVKIYFGGIITVVLFNTANGIFSALGDSRHPLYYLIISSVLNAVLDILFVAVFKFGIAGAAVATVISQGISTILAFAKLLRIRYEKFSIQLNKLSMDIHIFKEFMHIGIPSGIMNSVISIANIFVQSSINSFGSAAVAGCGAYSKISGFAFIPITSFSMAMTTFIGQNLGAKEYSRAKKGSIFAIFACCLLSEIIGVVYNLSAPALLSIFVNDPNVIAFGVLQAKTVTLFYFLLAFSHCVSGILRGAGNSTAPMVIMLSCWCIIRVIYIYFVTHFFKDISHVFYAYPLTWFLSSVLFLTFYIKSDWLHNFDNQ